MVVDQSTNYNFQINSGIKIPNTCKYLKDENEINSNQQVVPRYIISFF